MKPDDSLLLDIEPDLLRAAEFMQAKELLGAMVGRRIVKAELEDTRIVVGTDDGTTYFFYGFMGEEKAGDED